MAQASMFQHTRLQACAKGPEQPRLICAKTGQTNERLMRKMIGKQVEEDELSHETP